MLKYHSYFIGFREIPNEITLCINISNCPIKCPKCHSKWLWEDVGNVLDINSLNTLIEENKGISCISIMGGDRNPEEVLNLLESIDIDIKKGWYSGQKRLPKALMSKALQVLDYLKLGPYIEDLGPLGSLNSNQSLYKIKKNKDITYYEKIL